MAIRCSVYMIYVHIDMQRIYMVLLRNTHLRQFGACGELGGEVFFFINRAVEWHNSAQKACFSLYISDIHTFQNPLFLGGFSCFALKSEGNHNIINNSIESISRSNDFKAASALMQHVARTPTNVSCGCAVHIWKTT